MVHVDVKPNVSGGVAEVPSSFEIGATPRPKQQWPAGLRVSVTGGYVTGCFQLQTASLLIRLLSSNSARFGCAMKGKPPCPLRICPMESYVHALSNACDLSLPVFSIYRRP